MTTDEDQIAGLRSEIEELRKQNLQARVASVPAEQRAGVQAQANLDEERRVLAGQRAELNQAALSIHAENLASKTGVDASVYLEKATLREMDQLSVEKMSELIADPAKLRQFADVLDRTGPPIAPVTPAAPGATAEPTGAGQPGTSGVPVVDPVDEILKRYAGKGSASLAAYLEEINRLPASQVRLDGTPVQPAPAPNAELPIPAAAPANPPVVPAAVPATTPATTPAAEAAPVK